MACVRDFGRGHENDWCFRLRTATVDTTAPSTAPHTSVQYRNPATASPIMLVASTSVWLTSMSASALKRRSRCSNARGMVLNEVMTKVALMATTTSGRCGA